MLAALGVNSEGGGAVSEWLGPNGVVRKSSFCAIGFIGPNGVKRIDRSGLQQGGQAAATTTAARSVAAAA